jgi:hypothetical protein
MSFIYKTQDLDRQYQKILTTQKDLIKNNKYMRELEAKYHKPKRKSQKISVQKRSFDNIQIHNWPVDSHMFAKVLKSRLDLIIPDKKIKFELKNSKNIIPKPKSSYRYSSTDGKFEVSIEKSDINLCMNKKARRQGSVNLKNPYNYRPKPLRTYTNSPKGKKLTNRGLENSLNDSLDYNIDEEFRDIHLISIPRYY